MENNTDLEIMCVGFTNGLNAKLQNLVEREKFIKYDESLIHHYENKEGKDQYSSIPMWNYDKVDFVEIPLQFGAGEAVEDEDANEKLLATLKEKQLDHSLADITKMAHNHRESLRKTFEQMMEKNPINRHKHPLAYEFLRKRVLEPDFIPLVQAKPGFYTKPKEIPWKRKSNLYIIASYIPKIAQHDIFRLGYLQIVGEFMSGSIDPFIKKLQHCIHYAIKIVPEEWKFYVFLSYLPIS